jgi:hypothetical protein
VSSTQVALHSTKCLALSDMCLPESQRALRPQCIHSRLATGPFSKIVTPTQIPGLSVPPPPQLCSAVPGLPVVVLALHQCHSTI